ncbi:MAG: hypothetical protein PHV34_06550 [Verrucomicrobiae bacterium]|nr:hypothetical protein [Verrucomicrobiae bacterium]
MMTRALVFFAAIQCCMSLCAKELSIGDKCKSPDGQCEISMVKTVFLWPDNHLPGLEWKMDFCSIVISKKGVSLKNLIVERRRTHVVWAPDSKFALIADSPDKGNVKLVVVEVDDWQVEIHDVNFDAVRQLALREVPVTEDVFRTLCVESVETISAPAPASFAGVFRRAGGKKEALVKFEIARDRRGDGRFVATILSVSKSDGL